MISHQFVIPIQKTVMKNKSNNWSIQISIPTASALKEYCDDNGFKMNWFVETAINLCISSSLIMSCVRASALHSGSYGK